MNPKVLAVIPARGGSKGVARKNIRNLVGKPLIAWTIETARQSKYIDKIIVSSEDDEIIKVAKKYGAEVPFVRPAYLAEDTTTSIETILHAIEQCPGFDYIVLLQPTSPLREPEDIDGCIKKAIEGKGFCVSVCEVTESPYWMYTLSSANNMQHLIESPLIGRRQDLPKVYTLNGAVYVANIRDLKQTKSFINENTVAYQMPSERSCDIDTELDFIICEYLMKSS
ncbi:acylneuraminate cytidylyltransferase family protein [Metasolibacillus sp.]|uniref:acylneuraminate cytidylyltransferase family protein n=1 Tax=Metasolibacillus sp. TaxID=2703680 RepID=UPI0025FE7545|nr:acylneuraminate cytidylyltransferase family protein [Metasolibacillus sp.]MCT6925666.1 acylneuraminate cytidylyltransferase family protein [Metasolibacillus sp.]MCT6940986.1 acylneuraminate cytidylyltransferase family protein [Metasolibacillus sp.]